MNTKKEQTIKNIKNFLDSNLVDYLTQEQLENMELKLKAQAKNNSRKKRGVK
jgi:ATP/maltotriose-dependent transcriptional regulator MalT